MYVNKVCVPLCLHIHIHTHMCTCVHVLKVLRDIEFKVLRFSLLVADKVRAEEDVRPQNYSIAGN